MLITFPEIKYSDPDIVGTYGRAVEQWHDRNNVNVPIQGQNTQRENVYYRGAYTRICKPARKQYDWQWLDNNIIACINKRQKFAFGLMALYPEGNDSTGLARYTDGTFGAYPQWLHDQFQKEQYKDWKTGSTWVPPYNSPFYRDWLLEVHTDINNHLLNTYYQAPFGRVRFFDVISYIDVRGYGSWGEWHHANVVEDMSQFPTGTRATGQSLIDIINTHVNGYPNKPLVSLIATFDANWLKHTMNPPEVAHHALTVKNLWGYLGWRRDQWGATDNYIRDYLENNNRSYNGLIFKVPIMERWRYAPIVGEPPGWSQSYAGLEAQIRAYHATSFGNGNYGQTIPSGVEADYIRAASKACGYRLRVTDADYNVQERTFGVRMNWLNLGIAPAYDDWDVVFQLLVGGVKVDIATSSFKPKLFLPTTATKTVTETFTIPATIPNGSYKLSFVVRDPTAYMNPLPLAQTGRQGDGSYIFGDVTVGGVILPNQPPEAFAGSDQLIKTPVKLAKLSATAKDGDGTVVFGEWSVKTGGGIIKSKNAYITDVDEIPEGVNEYQWLVRDDDGATGTDTVKVTRQPADPTVPKTITKLEIYYSDQTHEVKP